MLEDTVEREEPQLVRLALTDKLGSKPAPFPGDHMGFETDAAGFAAALDTAFGR